MPDNFESFDNAPVGVAVFDGQGCFCYANSALAAINGVPPEDHIGRHPVDLFGEAVRPWVELVEKVLRTGEAVRPFRLTAEDEASAFEVAYYPLNKGAVTHVVAMVRDATAELVEESRLGTVAGAARRLAAAETPEAIGDIIATAGAKIGEGRATFAVADSGGLRLIALGGYPLEIADKWLGTVLPLSSQSMITAAARTGQMQRADTGSRCWHDIPA